MVLSTEFQTIKPGPSPVHQSIGCLSRYLQGSSHISSMMSQFRRISLGQRARVVVAVEERRGFDITL